MVSDKQIMNYLDVIVKVTICAFAIYGFGMILLTREVIPVDNTETIDSLENRLHVASMYIEELESVVEQDGTVVGDVCGGDGYAYWYSQERY